MPDSIPQQEERKISAILQSTRAGSLSELWDNKKIKKKHFQVSEEQNCIVCCLFSSKAIVLCRFSGMPQFSRSQNVRLEIIAPNNWALRSSQVIAQSRWRAELENGVIVVRSPQLRAVRERETVAHTHVMRFSLKFVFFFYRQKSRVWCRQKITRCCYFFIICCLVCRLMAQLREKNWAENFYEFLSS